MISFIFILNVLSFDTVTVSEKCSVDLVGLVAVDGSSATVVFRGVGSGIDCFLCRLDGVTLSECEF